MTNRLIFAPALYCVAYPELDAMSLSQWADAHGLNDIANDPNTPLAKLFSRVGGMEDETAAASMVEFAGRFCYRSWNKGRDTEQYINNIIDSGHGSVLEHVNFTFAISGVSRSFSHELVRHSAGVAISQESQRYVDGKDMRFVVPPLMRETLLNDEKQQDGFLKLCESYLHQYAALQEACEKQAEIYNMTGHMGKKRANEAARCVLPNMTETRLVWTANVRSLRHVISTRGSDAADLEIRFFAYGLAIVMKQLAPLLFADVSIDESEFPYIPPVVKLQYPKV